MKRNNRIIAKAFKSFFVASVMISLIEQINSLTDSFIVSHLIDEDALSVIGLVTPVKLLVYVIPNMILAGTSILAAIKIGERKYKTVNRYFTLGLITESSFIALLYLLLLPCMDEFCQLFTTDERLLPYLHEYMPVTLINCIVSSASMVIMTFIKIDGMPKMVTRCVIMEGLCNLVFDYIFIKWCHMGIAGAAWATILSVVVAVIALLWTVKQKHSILHFETKEMPHWYVSMMKEIVPIGVPACVGTLSMGVLRILLNDVILKCQGADGMFVMAVSMQLLMVCGMFSSGASGAITGIGGVLLGEKDHEGFRVLIRYCFNYTVVFVLLVTGVLVAWPEYAASLFGAGAELQVYSEEPLRIMFMTFLPVCLADILTGVYNLQKYNKFVTIANITQLVLPLILAILAMYFAPNLIWYAYPLGSWIRLVMVLFISFSISRKTRLLRHFTLIPILPEDPSVEVCVRYDMTNYAESMESVNNFASICVNSKELKDRVVLCIEEVANNIIARFQHKGKHQLKDVLSIRMIDENDKLSIIIKEASRPFNPIMKFEPEQLSNIDEDMLPLMILNGMCDDIKYNYTNGINCVYMTFPISAEERQ